MLTPSRRCCNADESSFPCASREDSRIVRTALSGGGGSNNTIRMGHITTILPLTIPTPNGGRVPADIAVGIQEGGFLALEHFNRRSGALLSYLPHRLEKCDFYWTWENRETMFSPIRGATEFMTVVQEKDTQAKVEHDDEDDRSEEKGSQNDDYCPPFAVLGAAMSTVTKNLAILGGALEVPVISAVSGASDLDGLPFFSRTSLTSAGDAHAIALYLQHLDVTHAAIVYKQDSWGIAYNGFLAKELQFLHMNVLSLPYQDGQVEPIIEQLAKSQFRYVVAIIDDGSWRDICTLGYSYGVMGHPGYTWIIGDGMADLAAGMNVRIDRTDETITRAMHGASVVMIDVPFHESFEQNLLQIANNQTIQNQFIQHFAEPKAFDNYNFTNALISVYSYLSYDAVMALGMAACDTPGLFTSQEFYQTLLYTRFEGVSGFVSFDNQTHTRSGVGVRYGVRNIVLSEELSTSTHFVLTNNVSSFVNTASHSIDEIQPYIYTDNTTDVPLSLPALVQEYNLVPDAAIAFGNAFCGLVLMSSVFWMIWTWYNRNSPVVRASQPIFLCQLCLGTFIMGSSVIPLSLQDHGNDDGHDSNYRLDVACMSLPWLFSIGFVASFSALFAKTWRLNQVFRGGMACRRIQVQPKDVAWPFVVLMALNFIILGTWTILDPMKWERISLSNYDSFGRSQESYGDCQFNNVSFLLLFLFVNLLAVMKAMYQSYVGRNLPIEFSESYYLTLSVASLLETTILAVPVLVVTVGNPTASYLLRSCFVCIFSFTILLPIFVPKYQQQRRAMAATDNKTGTRAVRSTLRGGGDNYGSQLQNNNSKSRTAQQTFSGVAGLSSIREANNEMVEGGFAANNEGQKNHGVLRVYRLSAR